MKPSAASRSPARAAVSGVRRRRRRRGGSSSGSSSQYFSFSYAASSSRSAGGSGWVSRSLKAESLHWSQGRGAAGGIGPEEEAGGHGRSEGEEHRVGRDDGVDAGDRELAAHDSEHQPGHAAEDRHEHGLGEELRE